MKRIMESVLEFAYINWEISLPIAITVSIWVIRRELINSKKRVKQRSLHPFTGLQSSRGW